MKVHVTPEIMTKVWKLHEKEIDFNLIAETLGISESSARRIINIMTTAQTGGDVDSIGGKNHRAQKDFAKKFFGIEEKKEEEKPIETQEEQTTDQQEEQKEEQQNSADADVKEYMQKVLLALAWQNELLEQFLSAFGVDWKTFKGAERR